MRQKLVHAPKIVGVMRHKLVHAPKIVDVVRQKLVYAPKIVGVCHRPRLLTIWCEGGKYGVRCPWKYGVHPGNMVSNPAA